MSIRARLARLKRLPPGQIPAVAAARFRRMAFSVLERWTYRPNRPWSHHAGLRVETAGLFHAGVHRDDFPHSFRSQFPQDADRLVEKGRSAAVPIVDLLGSGPVNLSELSGRVNRRFEDGTQAGPSKNLPWNFDFKTGIGWKYTTFFSDIRYGQVAGLDIKVPWELSRCAHFVTLGQAYRLTGEDVFVRSFVSQLEDWISSNPPKYGVNWACPMDVGLRAANWLLAWELMGNSKMVPDSLRSVLPSVLYEHGLHIRRHLEWGAEVSSNHYLSNLLGLLAIGYALRQMEWVHFAEAEFDREILNQTYEDGMDFEGSTAYHRLVTEIFFFQALIRRRKDSRLPAASQERLKKMFETVDSLLTPAGDMPFIGDNDSGRVHVLYDRADEDMRYLSDLGAAYFNDSGHGAREWGVTSEAAWLFGFDNAAVKKTRQWSEIPARTPGDSNLATIKGPGDLLVFNAQANGTRGVGSHSHNDKLSFFLAVGPEKFIVDPGTGCYTPDPATRNLFRSTVSHSTVQIDEEEQARFVSGNLFTLCNDARVSSMEWEAGRRVAAGHTGYQRLSSPVHHKRSIERRDAPVSWFIRDEFEGKGEHRMTWSFVCAPGLAVRADGTAAYLEGKEGQLEIRSNEPNLKPVVTKGQYSRAYGRIEPISIVRFEMQSRMPLLTAFTLTWTRKG